MLLAAFEPASKETAIFLLVGVIAFALAGLGGPTVGKRVGGAVGLVGLGLAFVTFPGMWQAMKAAF